MAALGAVPKGQEFEPPRYHFLSYNSEFNFFMASKVSRTARSAVSYWPPADISRKLNLPSGRKQCFVCLKKNDEDGTLEASLIIASKNFNRLLSLNREELTEFERMVDRFDEYIKLWESKAALNSNLVSQYHPKDMLLSYM